MSAESAKQVEDRYFTWLCGKILLTDAPTQTYFNLLKQLFTTEFVWIVLGDDNRAEDGRTLRYYFFLETQIEIPLALQEEPCSVLEMLWAFAKRCDEQTEMNPREWFWEFIRRLGLGEAYDGSPGMGEIEVNDRVSNFVWRVYESDGTGGLFPMYHTFNDQREVEIWYQFAEFLVDHDVD